MAQEPTPEKEAGEASSQPERKPGKGKVHWTEEERRILARHYFVYLQEGQFKGAAFELAQRALPYDRRRQIPSVSSLKWLDTEIERLKLQEAKEKAFFEGKESLPQPSKPAGIPAPAAAAPGQPAPPGAAVDFAVALQNLLGDTVEARLRKLLLDPAFIGLFKEALAGTDPNLQSRAIQTTSGPAYREGKEAIPHKPRVLIAGLISNQINEMRKTFGANLDLKFWQSSESKDQLRTLVKGADVVIGVTDFMAHASDSIAKSLAPEYIRHSGGVSSLKRLILETDFHKIVRRHQENKATESKPVENRPPDSGK